MAIDYGGTAAIIGATGAFIVNVGGFVVMFRQQEQIRKAGRSRDAKIEELHASVNGQSEALKTAIAGENFATGKEAGIKQERATPMIQRTP